jgi:hypothetical protein
MKIYFEDGALMHTSLIPVEVDFKLDASNGVTRNIEMLDLINERRHEATVYTNSIFALHNMYAWNEELKAPEIYIRAGEHMVFTRIDKLTNRELRQGHNLAKMYVSGEFDNGVVGKLNCIKE